MAKHLNRKAYLLTGGNMGDREANLAQAREHITKDCGPISFASRLYQTAAWGLADQPAFLNQALEIETTLTASQLLKTILQIEKKLGRVRKEKNGPRIIDIDIILFGDENIDLPDLKVPHPEMANRRFVLVPLAEIAAHVVHPVLHKTISQLLEECKDPLAVIDFRFD